MHGHRRQFGTLWLVCISFAGNEYLVLFRIFLWFTFWYTSQAAGVCFITVFYEDFLFRQGRYTKNVKAWHFFVYLTSPFIAHSFWIGRRNYSFTKNWTKTYRIPASNACASYHINFLLLTLQISSVLLDFIQRIVNCFDNRIIGSNTQQACDLHLYLSVFWSLIGCYTGKIEAHGKCGYVSVSLANGMALFHSQDTIFARLRCKSVLGKNSLGKIKLDCKNLPR